MILEFEVLNQTISRTENNKTVEKSHNYLSCKFNFTTDDWSGMTKAALFKTTDMEKPVVRLLVNDECDFPNGASCGNCNIAVIGGGSEDIDSVVDGEKVSGVGTIITTNTINIAFEDTLDTECMADFTDPENDFTKFLTEICAVVDRKVGDLVELKTTDKSNIVNAINDVINNSMQIKNANGGFEAGEAANAGTGGAVGYNAYAKGGFAGGKNATAKNSGAAAGLNSDTNYGGSLGYGAQSENGGAVGQDTRTENGFAGGYGAKTVSGNSAIDAIQLGTGTNNTPKTMQVYKKRIVEADGSLTDVGNLSELRTVDKSSVVRAINEVNNKITVVTTGSHTLTGTETAGTTQFITGDLIETVAEILPGTEPEFGWGDETVGDEADSGPVVY